MPDHASSTAQATTLESKKLVSKDGTSSLTPPRSLSRSGSYNATLSNPDNDPEEEPQKDPWEATFRNRKGMYKRLGSFFLMIAITVGLPLALYYATRDRIGTLYALLLSGAPPLLHTLYVFARRRRVDVFGLLMVTAFVISAVISIVTGNSNNAMYPHVVLTYLL